jgi:PIN domain nuclease of toxin-antitoxin system
MTPVLLDTNAFIRIVTGAQLRPEAIDVVAQAVSDRCLWISAVTAWEIGLLADSTHTGPRLGLGSDPMAWLKRSTERTRALHLPLGVEAALAASYLPEPFHKDPADRMLVAQAREGDLTLITRDRAILDYAAAGHVRAIAC